MAFNPKREDGLMAYVVATHSWGRTYERIEWADSLKSAKAQFGWTRQLHTSVTVRRATTEDVATNPEETTA